MSVVSRGSANNPVLLLLVVSVESAHTPCGHIYGDTHTHTHTHTRIHKTPPWGARNGAEQLIGDDQLHHAVSERFTTSQCTTQMLLQGKHIVFVTWTRVSVAWSESPSFSLILIGSSPSLTLSLKRPVAALSCPVPRARDPARGSQLSVLIEGSCDIRSGMRPIHYVINEFW